MLLLSVGEGLLFLREVSSFFFDFGFWLVGFEFFVWAVAVPFGFIAFFLPPPNSFFAKLATSFDSRDWMRRRSSSVFPY